MAPNVTRDYTFSFSVRQRQRPPINDLPLSRRLTQDEVAIEFRVNECRHIKKFIGDDIRPAYVAQNWSLKRPRSFWVPKDAALLSDGGARMSSLLSNVGVPAQNREEVLRDIALVAGAQSAGTATSPIVVTLVHMTVVILEFDHEEESQDDHEEDSQDEMDMVLRESMDVDLVRTTPATRSSIEGLEKVTYEQGLGSIDECIFCTEEFKGGVELTRLPCSHVYHGDCIVKWLEQSHLCPLCRFPLPAAD